MLKFKKILCLALSMTFLSVPLAANAKSPILNKSYYSIDKNTRKLKFEGLSHTVQGLELDSEWHTTNIDGKSFSFRIKNATYNKSASDMAPSTGLNRIYSIANGQTLEKSISNNIVNKKGTVINKRLSEKYSISLGASVGKFLNFKNGLSKDSSISGTGSNIEEKNETSTISEKYSFSNDLKGNGYNSLDFYTMTRYDVFDLDVEIFEPSVELIASSQSSIYIGNSGFCSDCNKELPNNSLYFVDYSYERDHICSIDHIHPDPNYSYTLIHVDRKRNQTSTIDHIALADCVDLYKFLRVDSYEKAVINGEEILNPKQSHSTKTISLQYLKPYQINVSSPWKITESIPTTPDPKMQLVMPGTQKIIEENGKKYLLTITDSSLIARASTPDETLPPLRVSIAKGQSLNKKLSSTLTKTQSLEKVASENYNFSSSLGSSLFKILSFEAGLNLTLNLSQTNFLSQSTSINISSENNYSFPEEFANQGNSLTFNTSNDYAEFLVTAKATPINADGSINDGQTINMKYRYRQPFIKSYSIPSNY